MIKTKQSNVKKRLAFFFGASAVAFVGLACGLKSLSANAEVDICDGHEECVEIKNVNGTSGYVVLGVEGHQDEGEQIGVYFNNDYDYDADEVRYESDYNYYSFLDEELDTWRYGYYYYSDGKPIKDTVGFSLYMSSFSNEAVTEENFSDYYTVVIELEGKTIAKFSCQLENEDGYSDTICRIRDNGTMAKANVPKVTLSTAKRTVKIQKVNYGRGGNMRLAADTDGQTSVNIPSRGASLVVYRAGEEPAMLQTSNPASDSDDLASDPASDETVNANTSDAAATYFIFFGAAVAAVIMAGAAIAVVCKRA